MANYQNQIFVAASARHISPAAMQMYQITGCKEMRSLPERYYAIYLFFIVVVLFSPEMHTNNGLY